MKKRQVDHVLRAAGRITGERKFIIFGSHADELRERIRARIAADFAAAAAG